MNTRADTLVCIDQSGRRSRNLRALVERLGLTSAQSTRSGKSSEKGSSRMATRGCYRKARGETRVFPRGETATRDAIVYAITKPLAHCGTTRAAAPGGGTMSSAVSARPPGGQHRDPELTPTKDQPKAGALGLTSATMLVIGTVIGAGVFTMPAVLASAGTISLAVLAVIAVGAMVLAILFGQLTRRVPNSDGGLYAYARYEFGDFAGYLTGWCYWVQAWAGNAAIRSEEHTSELQSP